MGTKIPSYVKYLAHEFEMRSQSNAQYSLRVFAKYLGVDASFLSKVLARRLVLSLKQGEKLAARLCLSEDDRKKFLLSIAEEQKCKSLAKVDTTLTDCDK